MDVLPALCQYLQAIDAHVASTITFEKLFIIVLLTSRLKNDILLSQPADHDPDTAPLVLSPAICYFLARTCGLDEFVIEGLWDCLRCVIWSPRVAAIVDKDGQIAAHLTHGHPVGLTFKSIYPPFKTCPEPGCSRTARGLSLSKTEARRVVLYTLEHGSLPAWSVHYYCEACAINYHHNFSVRQNERTYYRNIPEILQIGEHHFAEVRIISSWITLMLVAWVSGTNCARWYNTALAAKDNLNLVKETEWQFQGKLTSELVYTAFTVLSLLEDCERTGATLVVPHTGMEKDRFTEAVSALNHRRRHSHPEVYHACKDCTRWYPDGKKCSVSVMDGVTVGRPRCSESDCKEPLANTKHRYCPTHAAKEMECFVDGCTTLRVEGSKACSLPEHAAVNTFFQLKAQSRTRGRDSRERAGVANPNSSDAPVADDDVEDAGGDSEAPAAPVEALSETELHVVRNPVTGEYTARMEAPADVPTGEAEGTGGDDGAARMGSSEAQLEGDTATRRSGRGAQSRVQGEIKLKCKPGRCRTHNEQLIIAPCGMVIARDTFHRSEGPKACVEFIKRVYRVPGTMPDHIFFDNNCTLKKVVDPPSHPERRDPHFANTGLTVDVFHFNCKHSILDGFCREHCDPSAYPELRGENGKRWYFNSSIAEQTNAWFGGYHNICREMTALRYDFFLDEMIRRRNEETLQRLVDRGSMPINTYGLI